MRKVLICAGVTFIDLKTGKEYFAISCEYTFYKTYLFVFKEKIPVGSLLVTKENINIPKFLVVHTVCTSDGTDEYAYDIGLREPEENILQTIAQTQEV